MRHVFAFPISSFPVQHTLYNINICSNTLFHNRFHYLPATPPPWHFPPTPHLLFLPYFIAFCSHLTCRYLAEFTFTFSLLLFSWTLDTGLGRTIPHCVAPLVTDSYPTYYFLDQLCWFDSRLALHPTACNTTRLPPRPTAQLRACRDTRVYPICSSFTRRLGSTWLYSTPRRFVPYH